LQSATMAGARYFQVENETSAIEPGKIADLVLLNENPLKQIRALRSVNSVIVRGKLYDRKQLDNFLEEAHQRKLQLDKLRAR